MFDYPTTELLLLLKKSHLIKLLINASTKGLFQFTVPGNPVVYLHMTQNHNNSESNRRSKCTSESSLSTEAVRATFKRNESKGLIIFDILLQVCKNVKKITR